MSNLRITYHNINENIIRGLLTDNKKKIEEIKNTLIDLPCFNTYTNKYINKIIKLADKLLLKKDNFIVLGTGGSNLGARALINILKNRRKKISFFDNIDPFSFKESITRFNLVKTGIIIISKSGSTSETLSQFSSIISIIKDNYEGDELFKDFIIITENKESPIREIAKSLSCTLFDHNPDIGGRFSIFSNVALLPAYLAGLNINKIFEGSVEILSELKKNSFEEYVKGSLIIKYLYNKQSVNLNVLMTYSDSLFYFGRWYLQLLAESIGKNKKGITPLHFIGTTDQHSQLQLYLEGPEDKFFSLITTNHKDHGLIMNKEILNKHNLNYLAGKKMGDLMYAEQQATLNTFIKSGLPVREIYCETINENTIGQLVIYYMIEIISLCYLINVDPFNQPAVEQVKNLTKKYLS